MKKKILFSAFLIISIFMGCRGEETVDKVVERIDLPKVSKDSPVSPEVIKKNIETTVKVIKQESRPQRKLRIFNSTPTPTGRIWPVLDKIKKNEPRRIVYETTENTISVAEKTLENILDLAFNPNPTPTPTPKPKIPSNDEKIRNSNQNILNSNISMTRDAFLAMDDIWLEDLGKEKIMGDVDGLQWGRLLISENESFYIGQEKFENLFSVGSIKDEIGYFYSSQSGYANPDIKYGYVVDGGEGLCGSSHNGYQGYITQNGNMSNITWGVYDGVISPIAEGAFSYEGIKDEVYTITFGTRASNCYQGQLLFLQGGKLGIIDPIKMTNDGKLFINWWLVDIDLGMRSMKREKTFNDLFEQKDFFNDFYGPPGLKVQVNDSTHYSGEYEYHSEINNKPVWINRECGDAGSKYQYCYIVWYQDINGARDNYGSLIDDGTWVLQPVLPSNEWNAHAYTDSEWPWGGGWSDNISRIAGR